MKIGDLAKKAGLSVHTIRYYEKIGLLPQADRDAGGRRDYDASILTWLDFLGRLKATGMPIREMLQYAVFRAAGDQTARERRDLLIAHRAKVKADIATLQNNLTVLDTKIATYTQSINDETDPDDARHEDTAERPCKQQREREPV